MHVRSVKIFNLTQLISISAVVLVNERTCNLKFSKKTFITQEPVCIYNGGLVGYLVAKVVFIE